MWAVHHGLKLIQDKKWSNAIVETNSQLTVQLLKGEKEENHSLSLIIDDCKALMEKWKTVVVHTLGEGNKCADKLTKLGVGQPGEANRMLVLPPELIKDLKADIQGTSFDKGSLLFFLILSYVTKNNIYVRLYANNSHNVD